MKPVHTLVMRCMALDACGVASRLRIRVAVLVPLALITSGCIAFPTKNPSDRAISGFPDLPIFVFETDEFWLNLHHFLYVLGRAQNNTRDATREPAAHAPQDSEQGLAKLALVEQQTWHRAIAFYAAGLSRKDLIFDDPLPELSISLAQLQDASSMRDVTADPELLKILEQAAPLYRKVWWPAHHAANQARRGELQGLVNKHGRQILGFITGAYQMNWPASGYPVHFSAYANWGGAYSAVSANGGLLVVSSLDSSNSGADGLETIFHEGMHQWDDQMNAVLNKQAAALKLNVPLRLSHALVFFTAAEAVRSAFPDYVDYAQKTGVWQRGMEPLRQALEEGWKPYLAGRGSRDEAIAAVLRRCNAKH